MKILIITSSPNKDGLTAACGRMAELGVKKAGAEPELICLNDYKISSCHACGNGWGTCRSSNSCQYEDDFQKLYRLFKSIDGFIIISPVYYGEMSECCKSFFDRLRRCESTLGEKTTLYKKQVITIAAAGGGGGGTLTCLSSFERLIQHLRMEKYDMIGITRKNRDYMLDAICKAAQRMSQAIEHSSIT